MIIGSLALALSSAGRHVLGVRQVPVGKRQDLLASVPARAERSGRGQLRSPPLPDHDALHALVALDLNSR